MKYKVLQRTNPGSKDITAFYGLNRTGKINDFQLADMENMDAERFPFIGTRRARTQFWGGNDGQPAMELICSDTDIYDDYQLTGVTKDGGFVYRGKTYADGGYSENTCITEHMGDYVLFPSKKVVTIQDDSISTVELNAKEVGFLGDRIVTGYSISEYTASVGTYFRLSSNTIWAVYSRSYDFNENYNDFFFEKAAPGRHFSLALFSRYGAKRDGTFKQEYKCDIPDDVYMVMDEIYYTYTSYDGTVRVSYGDDDFTESAVRDRLRSDKGVIMYITFETRRTLSGDTYDISRHFMHYPDSSEKPALVHEDVFLPGLAYVSLDGWLYDEAWNDFHIYFTSPVMLFGASYGGRLFACDNLGITIYYAASGTYDFTATDASGGAGYLSCAEPGKWVALCVYNDVLYAFKRNGMYRIYSPDGLTYYMDKIADVGAITRSGVCVAGNVLYFLSDDGIYQFTGAYPQLLPDSLGRRYTGGALGGDDKKLFASLSYKENNAEKTELVVWHTDKQIFSRHDDFCAVQLLTAMGNVYALAEDGAVYQMDGARQALPFSLTTKNYFFGFAKKAANAARIYFELEEGEADDAFSLEISCDGGAFEPCGARITNGRVRYIPIRFRKCDELALKISGKGIFTLKGISFALYQGGDIKQNHLADK